MSSSVSLLYVLIVWLLLIGQSEQACDAECITCTQDNTCSVCKVGFYVDGNYTLCSPCQQEGCTCTATQNCTGCIPGYYTYYSAINQANTYSKCDYSGCTCSFYNGCDLDCLPGYHYSSGRCYPCNDRCTCSSIDNRCTGCRDGYYLGEYNGTVYCYVCTDNCKLCSGGTTSCTKCDDGYFLNNNRCDACDPTCSVCTSMTLCSACTDGFYLNSQTCCSNNCNRCTSSSCDTCAEGYGLEWRDNRNVCEQCPSNCLVCSYSISCDTCITGYYRYWSGSTYLCVQCQPECLDCQTNGCNQCKEGYFLVNQCYNCPEGCMSCSGSTLCNTCQDGYYRYKGSVATLCQPCMDNCKTCDAANTCTECNPGYRFKENVCQQDCPVNCNNNSCSEDKKMCTAGCKDGYYGSICDQNCSTNCISCDQNSRRCTVCEDGFYGDVCFETCSSGCKTTNGTAVCNIIDGACTVGCQLSTKYGPQCSKDCSVQCVDQACDHVTARCLKGCQPGYHGENCTFPCYEGCINGSCHDNSGSCDSGCKEGYTGEQCIAEAASVTEQPIDGGMIGGAVGGVVIGLLIIAAVVVGVCLLRRRRVAGKTVARNGNGAVSNTGDAIDENQAKMAELAVQMSSKEVWTQQYNRASSEVKQDAIAAPIRESTMSDEVLELEDKESNVVMDAVVDVTSEQDAIAAPMKETTMSTAVLELEDEEGNVVIDTVVDVTSEGYYNVGTLTRSVTLEALPAFVSGKSELKYKQEFKLLPQGLIKTHDESQKPVNVALNRYKGIYPYDETRVILRDGGVDYVNASYIDGYKEPKAYIAALGSTKKTIPDIWRMVWQEKVGKIVMLTNLVESGATKCELYWPDKGVSRNYTGIDVTTRAEEVYAEFTVRQFTLQKTGESRKVIHLHYTAWPDKGVPDDVTSLVEFRQKVEATSSTLEGPLLVHCSAGIGRTGTYLAMDILTKEGEAEGSVNIMGCVVKLREQRVNMVQTDEQFTYLHHAIVHSLTFHSHHVTRSSFKKHVHALCKAEANHPSQIESRFKLIQNTLEKKKKVDEESIALNKSFTNKNRSIDSVPADRYRPRLHLSLKPESPDYINAVFINSYKRKNELVLTQTPLPDTVVDFWRLVVQERTPCVVSMDDPLVENKTAVTYWPNNSDKVTFGIFRIKKTKSVTNKHCVINTLTVEYHVKSAVKSHRLTQFIFKGWSNTETVPPSPERLVLLIDQVERRKSQYEGSDGPIIVHCLSGSERSGLFCTLSILLEKMKTEQEVSVVNIVRSLKSRRSQVIPNLEQYTFCYKAVVTYLESFNTYSHFELK